ncbi:hypothetical protein GCM10022243_15720 [Saccharothrix violaceirubra]
MPLRVLLVLVVFLLGITTPASAQESVTWGVRPAGTDGRPNYGYSAAPGDTIRDAVAIANHGDRPITLLVYAADGFTTTSGQLDLLPAGQPSTDLGTWVALAQSQVEVPARSAVEVPFTITVPADAGPGDHSGGIVTSLAVPESSGGVRVDRRLGSRVHLRVTGEEKPALAIEGLSVAYDGNPFGFGTATVSFRVTNTGNLRAGGTQTIAVEGLFGLGGRERSVSVPELLPGAGSDFTVPFADVAPLVWLDASVRLVPQVAGGGALAEVTAETGTWAVPWVALLVLVAVAGLVVVLRLRARRRRAATDRRIAEAVEEALTGVR